MITDETIDRVKDAINIKDVVEDYIKLKRSGADWEACCPFHGDRTPSFKVSPAKKMYKCFGCGKGGDAISFVMEHEKLTYIQAIQLLAKKYNIEVEEFEAKEYVKPVPRLEKLSQKSLEFMERERHISNNTLLRFNVTEATEWMPQHKREVLCICFNYYKDGELVNIKFRGPQKAFKLAKDAELILYNLDAIKGEKKAIIVEGEIDCLTLHECGIYHVVSVPNGTPPNGKFRLEYMDNCWQYFTDKEEVIIATDNDMVGRKLRDELARRIGVEKCKQVVFPEGCKDANEILVKLGKDSVVNVFNTPIDWPLEGIYTPDEWGPEVDDFFINGYPAGYKTKIPGFDELLTFYPGQLTTVTGTPGSGKSEFVDYIMTSLSMYDGIKWGVFSFEAPVPVHATKLMEKFARKAVDFRKDLGHRMNKREYDAAKAKVKEYFHFGKISKLDVTMDGLLAKAEELVKAKGITGLLFDPWNCIEHKNGQMSETLYTLTCLNKLISFLEKYKVMGFLIAHPVKLNKDPKTGKYPIPTLYNIAGSAHFFNRTDNGFSVVRDFNTGQVDVYVQKVKLSWLGKVGFATFYYDTMTRQYNYLPADSGEDDRPIAPPPPPNEPEAEQQELPWTPVDTEDF
jgi:twinkle protein